jgi:SM-20-related protein
MIDVLEIADFLDAPTLEHLRAGLSLAVSAPATVTGMQPEPGVDQRVRRTSRLNPPVEIVESIRRLVTDRTKQLEDHFTETVTACEPPQFLRYETGDYFVPHQDGNTPLIHDHTRFRKISIVIFLSTPSVQPAPGTYGGGALVLHGLRSQREHRITLNPPPGTLIAFRAETTHEVTPVTHGERFTIACFLRHDP